MVGLDPLRDEGLDYGDKLKDAGDKTQIRCFSELIHPCLDVAGYLPAARKAFEESARLLKEALHNSQAK